MALRLHTALAVAALGACASPEPAGPPASPEPGAVPPSPEVLMEADRAFAADTAARGLDGWLAWYTEDAARPLLGQAAAARGKAAIAEQDGPMFARSDVQLRWEPTGAGLFEGGDTGFTTGRYEVVTLPGQPTERVATTGSYLSMWRLEPEGWRVFLDTGTQDPPAPAAE